MSPATQSPRRELTTEDLSIPSRYLARVYRIWRGHRDYDDLVASGFLGLVLATHRYDPALGEWESYAWRNVRGAILDQMRADDHVGRVTRGRIKAGTLPNIPVAGPYPPGWDEGWAVADPEDPYEHVGLREAVREAVLTLPADEQDVLRALFWEGRTAAAFGATVGVSESRISQRKTSALRRLRGPLACQVAA